MSNDICPKCGAALVYVDDPEQETASHVEGFYECSNGHIFDEETIEIGEDYDDRYEDDEDYDG